MSREIFTLASIYYNQDLHRGCLDGTQSIHIDHASTPTNKPVMSPTEARLMTRKFPLDEYDEQLHSANEKPSSQGLPPARENTGHTYSKKALPTICQTLKREPPILERRCRGRRRKKKRQFVIGSWSVSRSSQNDPSQRHRERRSTPSQSIITPRIHQIVSGDI